MSSVPFRGSRKVPTAIHDGAYELVGRLGAGCFGEVHRATVAATKQEVAVKFEEEGGAGAGQLEAEAKLLKSLLDDGQRAQGFAMFHWFGRVEGWNCLVMEFLSKNLEEHKQSAGQGGEARRMKEISVVLLAEQILRRIEYLHSRGYVHRDIKPENFAFGVGPKAHHLYIIDFGLSKRYWDKGHVHLRSKAKMTGTARYASLNAHRGMEHSRRDDLEAIGHMLIYFLRGSLPWSGLDAKTKQEKYRKIQEKKEGTRIRDLCQGHPAFESYLNYCRALGFSERPDYAMLRKLFSKVRLNECKKRRAPIQDWDFEWFANMPQEQKERLIPLEAPDDLQQPDDQAQRGSRLWRCFCPAGRAPPSE